MKQEILDKLKGIKLFLFDLEGVLLYNGDLFEEMSYRKLLDEVNNASIIFKKYNVLFGIVTARREDVLIDNLKKIENCKVLSTSVEKVSAVEVLVASLNFNFNEVFYIGDGILDIPLLRKCGLSASPKSAHREVKRIVNFTINSNSTEEVFKEIFNLFQKAGLDESNGFKGNISPSTI